jgi:glycosyltransferase involved in cell wall biosynthesis
MSQPFISICIPTYQRPHLLKKLLDSICIQTYRDFEILINDNSSDNSVEQLLKTYADKLPIDYHRNNPSTTASENCNIVMKRAKSEWIKIMHDDDWFATNDTLQQFADAAKHSGKDFIFSASTQVWLDNGKQQIDMLTVAKQQWLTESPFCLFYLNVIGHPSVTLHKKDNTVLYDTGIRWVLDIDFYMRYLQKHGGFQYINECLINIGKDPSQETNKYYKNRNVELPEFFLLLAKYEQDLNLKNRHVFHLIWNMLKRYKIKHPQEIHDAGYNGPLPSRIEKIIAYQKYIPAIIIKQTPWSNKLVLHCYKKVAADYIRSGKTMHNYLKS